MGVSLQFGRSIFVVFMIFFVGEAYGNTKSESLLKQGITSLNNKKFEEALEYFKYSHIEDSRNQQAIFFKGVTYNRLGEFEAACLALKSIDVSEFDPIDLSFEKGWCSLGVGEKEGYSEAINEFKYFLNENPTHGQALEFIGRAYFLRGEKGDYKEAEKNLTEAIKGYHTTTTKETVFAYLALVKKAQNKQQAAKAFLDKIDNQTQAGEQLAGIFGQIVNQTKQSLRKRTKSWQIRLGMGGGYNDNVIGLSNQGILPADVSTEKSAFARFNLNLRYFKKFSPKTFIRADYQYKADVYSKIPSFNLRNHYGSLTFVRNIYSKFVGAIRVSDGFTKIDNKKFRNQVGVRPSIRYRWSDGIITELNYFLAVNKYFSSTLPSRKRTGFGHTGGVNQYLLIPDTAIRLNFGYFYTRNNTKGSDFDARSHGLKAGVSTAVGPAKLGIRGNAYYRRTFDRYDNLNSFSQFSLKRRDKTDAVTVRLSWPLPISVDWIGWVRMFVRYDYFRIDSNIDILSFKQNTGSMGVITTF